jgi:hypothetical protein
MRTAYAVVALAASLPSLAAAQFSAHYDRFKDQTELWAPSIDVLMQDANRGRLVAQAFSQYPGRRPVSVPPLVRIALRVVSPDGWRYLKCHTMSALADGKPFELGPSTHDGDTIRGSAVLESVSVSLAWPDFAALSRARTVELRLCRTEIQVPAARLDDWRALVKAGTPSPN